MSKYYNIVPWFDSKEWHYVYNLIYSSSSFQNKEEALDILLVWKARCPTLPSGIESSLTLLEVHVQDFRNSNVYDNQIVRLAYSSAIMRFVNHMLDVETAKGTSLYQAAKNLGVPDWIVDLRHNTAHSNEIPSIELLREATTISLEWLQEHYWAKYKDHINDYIADEITKETEQFVDTDGKISALMNFCISLSFCSYSKCKIKNLNQIPDKTMRKSIVNDAIELFGDTFNISKLKTVSLRALINTVNTQSNKFLQDKDVYRLVNNALLGSDALFLSLDIFNTLNGSDLYSIHTLSKHYVKPFEVLLIFLHSNNLLLEFILELIKKSQHENNEKSKLAALWTSEIIKALGKVKEFHDKIDGSISNEIHSEKQDELKTLFYHWFPNERNSSLMLDLGHPVPPDLKDIKFIKPILSAYNPYLTYYIMDLLNIVEPNLPATTATQICNLAKLISSPNSSSKTSTKIYTVEDLKISLQDTVEDESSKNSTHCTGADRDAELIIQQTDLSQQKFGIWSLASKEHNWGSCPIGLLPWQINSA